jgi:hypothetical protein
MFLKEMVSMESNGQPRAAPAVTRDTEAHDIGTPEAYSGSGP